ncbi:Rpn family recombination-promoting nuclease/putative transposase [Magnetococcales bacterium HHB-1]
MTEIHQPHDKLIKAFLSRPKLANTMLRERLPKALAEQLDPGPPELIEGSYIDAKLKGRYADRLFKTKCVDGEDLYLYTLFEHKSQPESRIATQLLPLMTNIIMDLDAQQDYKGLLPPVIAIVLYHGRKKWSIEPRFSALVNAKTKIKPFLLDFPFILIDLGKIADEALSHQPELRGVLLILKYVYYPEEHERILLMAAKDLRGVDRDLLLKILRYLGATYGMLDKNIARQFVRTIRPEEENEMMSIFAQEMMAKGEIQGEAKLLQRLLHKKFKSIPVWASDKLKTADSKSLEIWGDRILDASSIDEIFKQ